MGFCRTLYSSGEQRINQEDIRRLVVSQYSVYYTAGDNNEACFKLGYLEKYRAPDAESVVVVGEISSRSVLSI